MHPAERLDADARAAWQGDRLSQLVARIYGVNPFYTRKKVSVRAVWAQPYQSVGER